MAHWISGVYVCDNCGETYNDRPEEPDDGSLCHRCRRHATTDVVAEARRIQDLDAKKARALEELTKRLTWNEREYCWCLEPIDVALDELKPLADLLLARRKPTT